MEVTLLCRSKTEYLQESFEKLRKFDLDKDGQRDIDQIVEILGSCGAKAKETLASTNAANIATGLEQIIAGATLIRSSFDQDKITALLREVGSAYSKITELTQLSITYVEEHGRR